MALKIGMQAVCLDSELGIAYEVSRVKDHDCLKQETKTVLTVNGKIRKRIYLFEPQCTLSLLVCSDADA